MVRRALDGGKFREKHVRMLSSYGWKLLAVELTIPVPKDGEFSKEAEDIWSDKNESQYDYPLYLLFVSGPFLP
jgi:hypothetical protein